MKRRELIAQSASVGFSSLLAGCRSDVVKKTDVIVIGAGLSGLHAAALLSDYRHNVVLLEARSRVGGRILSLDNVYANPEAGADTIHAAYGRTLNVVRRHNLNLIEAHLRRPMDMVYMLGGKAIPGHAWAGSPINPFSTGALRETLPDKIIFREIGGLADKATGALWCDPVNSGLDISMTDYLSDRGFNPNQIILVYNQNPWQGNEADNVSLLNWVFVPRFFAERHTDLSYRHYTCNSCR